jgi:hypothetical protein
MADELIRLDTTIIGIDILINKASTAEEAKVLFTVKDVIYSQQRYFTDVQPVKHGAWTEKKHSRMKWIPDDDDDIMEDEVEIEDMVEQKCSVCHRWANKFAHHIELNFCPYCGARMDGGGNG